MKSLFSSFLQPYVGNSKNGWQYCGLKGQVKYLKTYYMPEFITALLITIICSVLSFLIYYIYY